LTQEAGVRKCRSQVLRWNLCQALAYVGARTIAFTDLLLNILDDHEVRSVCAHELGHIEEPRLVRLARVAVTFLILPMAAARPIIVQWGLEYFALIYCGFILGIIGFRRMARRMEERADRPSLMFEVEPGIYARALEKAYRENLVPAVIGGKQVHPELYDRMVAAGIEPSYPRPKPPSKLRKWAAIVPIYSLVVALAYELSTFVEDVVARGPWPAGLLHGLLMLPLGAWAEHAVLTDLFPAP